MQLRTGARCVLRFYSIPESAKKKAPAKKKSERKKEEREAGPRGKAAREPLELSAAQFGRLLIEAVDGGKGFV